MSVTMQGRQGFRPGQFKSGWFLMNEFLVSATSEIVANWKDFGDHVSAVRIEYRNLQTATIYTPSMVVTMSTDGGTSFNVTDYLFQRGYLRHDATAQVWANSIGLSAAITLSVGTATNANIAGATGGTSYPSGFNMTIELPNVQGGGSSVPLRMIAQWPATTTIGINQMMGNGMLMVNTPVRALRIATLPLQSGAVEIWGMQARQKGFP